MGVVEVKCGSGSDWVRSDSGGVGWGRVSRVVME